MECVRHLIEYPIPIISVLYVAIAALAVVALIAIITILVIRRKSLTSPDNVEAKGQAPTMTRNPAYRSDVSGIQVPNQVTYPNPRISISGLSSNQQTNQYDIPEDSMTSDNNSRSDPDQRPSGSDGRVQHDYLELIPD